MDINIDMDSYILVERPIIRGKPETMVCRTLLFMWSFGPYCRWAVPHEVLVPFPQAVGGL